MKTTWFITFPRSGHHALLGLLDQISDFSSHYCEYYQCVGHDRRQLNCPKKTLHWTDKALECGLGRRVLKNHDFDLNMAFNPDCNYVVQFRHPFLSIESWYERRQTRNSIRKVRKVTRGQLKPLVKHQEWGAFFNENLLYWQQFTKKWLMDVQHCSNILPIEYESLSSTAVLVKLLEFCNVEASTPNALPVEWFKPSRLPLRTLTEDHKRLELELMPTLFRLGIRPLFS